MCDNQIYKIHSDIKKIKRKSTKYVFAFFMTQNVLLLFTKLILNGKNDFHNEKQK